ncbi:hypothetical protein A3860_30995 [Niastella vici]|uniref:Uncharacterized protein n=1 Tax=Niastella vici TaxID=1703345 RepID=A0A1V9FU71_9BACT|nr:hypothetical protein [Niastella vici]OQP61893.1 hypothetical protein A3860_30995 [Niastella vici]
MTDTKAIKQRFKSSIRRGTGEAHLIMQSNPSIDFSAAIFNASLNQYADDPQADGSRALYFSADIRKFAIEILERTNRPDD